MEVGSTLLKINSLSVSFGGLRALSNVSVELHPGEVVGLIGPNGAGKTTLFNALSGLVETEQPWPAPHNLVDLGIARTLQGVGLFPGLTVLENVMVGATKFAEGGLIRAALGFDGRGERNLRAQAMNALERVYAAGLANKTVESLPYPVTKRVAIARALVSDPKILLLDEPAGGLGVQDIDWMNGLIRNLTSTCAVLLVEHHMDVVMSVCHRLYVLNFGEVIASGNAQDVRQDPAVVAAYLGTQAVTG
jgi:branched-chain amino acid transport system ATP-binding protein